MALLLLNCQCRSRNAGMEGRRTGKEDSEPRGEDEDHAREDDGGKVR